MVELAPHPELNPLMNGKKGTNEDFIEIKLHVPHEEQKSESAPSNSKVQMKKELGLFDGIGIVVGVIIGSGIFISPSGVVSYTGSIGMSLVIWAASGCFAFIGAFCYAELGTMIPKSGGDYVYIQEVFGDMAGFLFLWSIILILLPTRNAIVAMTFANYIITPFFPNCEAPPTVAVKLVAAMVICFLTWLNSSNVKAATKVQDIFTVTKLLALAIIILAGFYYLITGHTENYEHPFEGTNWDLSALATAFYQGLFSFAGWNYLNFVVEELKDPYRNLPRTILISMPLVSIVYFLANVAYFAVLTPSEVISSPAVAVSFGTKVLGFMAWTIPVFVACSTFGGLNGGIFASSRLVFVGARQGNLPRTLALLNTKALTPVASLMFLASITLFMLTFSDITALINYICFTESVFILMSITGLLWLRYKRPNANRPIKVFIGLPIIFFIVSLFLVVLPIIKNPVELGIAIAIIVAGIPVYYLANYWNPKPKILQNIFNEFMSFMQVLTNSLPEEKRE